ncbi:MAG TPA: YhjD/YihY/BrkB family envelope integrity protein [Micromonosporaceae bacterium]|jgi:membrane protein
MNIFGAIEKGWDASIDWSRRHSKIFDHAWRARLRYNEVLGGRLAAAIAYYGFFAVFALALVAYAVVGFVLANNPTAVDAVNNFLRNNIPFLNADQIAEARNTVAIIGLIGFVFTGVGWIESLRSSQRAIWGVEQQPGNVIIRRLVDLAIMFGIGILLAVSLWVQAGINDAVKPVLLRLAPETVSVETQEVISVISRTVGVVLGLMVNVLLAASLLSGVSRLRLPLARLIPSSLLVAIGLLALSTVGRLYIDYTANRPAFRIVGGTVALLLFLYLFNQLLLYGAALAATSSRGEVLDLAAGATTVDESGESDGTEVSGADESAVGERRPDGDRPDPAQPATVEHDTESTNGDGPGPGAGERAETAPADGAGRDGAGRDGAGQDGRARHRIAGGGSDADSARGARRDQDGASDRGSDHNSDHDADHDSDRARGGGRAAGRDASDTD